MSLPDEGADEDEAQLQSEVAFTKRKITEKQYGKYDSITKEEIFAINNYCRDSLWRRAKFINDRQLGEEFRHICDKENIAPENRNHKYVDIILLIQNNMNYRRSYTTKRMRDLMVCKFLFFFNCGNGFIFPNMVFPTSKKTRWYDDRYFIV